MKKKRFVILVLLAAVICCTGCIAFKYINDFRKSRRIMDYLENYIPGYGAENGISSGALSDLKTVISVEKTDVCGTLEVPRLDINVPVTAGEQKEKFFAAALKGSPSEGNLFIIGGRFDVFFRLSKLDPGDSVKFTDIDGNSYDYVVRSQYLLKKWDEGEGDLKLCCRTDRDTFFVVSCVYRD